MNVHELARARRRDALLRRSYEGEVIGYTMYGEMLARSAGRHRRALVLLERIERITANALEPALAYYRVEVAEADAVAVGRTLGVRLAGRPWRVLWAEVAEMAEEYLRDYRDLAVLLEPGDAAIGRQVIEHEEALLDFARRETGAEPGSLEPLRAHLERYGR